MHFTNIATGSQILWRMVETYGKHPAPLFEDAGIDVRSWQDPYARFSHAQIEALWRGAEELVGDPCLGLRAASCWRPTQFHALGFAWLASDTLAEAAARLVRYFRVITDASVLELSETSEHVTLSVLPTPQVRRADRAGQQREQTQKRFQPPTGLLDPVQTTLAGGSGGPSPLRMPPSCEGPL